MQERVLIALHTHILWCCMTQALFSRLVVAVDPSENANRAFEYALRLAKLYGASVTLVYAIEAPQTLESYVSNTEIRRLFHEEGRNLLDGLAKRAEESGVKSDTVLREGHPAQVILDAAKATSADMIVMGSRGLGGIKELLLGSVSRAVISHASVPVLIVK